MLIEQIIGPAGRKCTPATGYFHNKTKNFKANFGEDYYYLLQKIAGGNVPYFPIPGPNHTKFNPKLQNFNGVLDLKCTVRGKIKQFNFLQLAFEC